jgi:hypothetical protein
MTNSGDWGQLNTMICFVEIHKNFPYNGSMNSGYFTPGKES